MFRKYYKEANDDIKPDRALIDKIFEKAEEPPKKTKVYKMYRYSAAVAAVMVLAVSAVAYPYIANMNKEVNTENAYKTKIADVQNSGSAAAKPENDEISAAAAEDTITESTETNKTTAQNSVSQSSAQKSPKNTVGKISEKETVKTDAAAEKEILKDENGGAEKKTDSAAVQEESAEDTDTSMDALVTPYSAKAADSAVGAASASGASDDSGRSFKAAQKESGYTVIWSAEKYKNYIGVDVESKAQLPQGMEPSTGKEFYLVADGDKIVNDTAVYVFTDDKRYLAVSVSKITSNEDYYSGNDSVKTKMINGKEVYTEINGNAVFEYFKNDGVYYSITAFDISENDVDTVAKSLID